MNLKFLRKQKWKRASIKFSNETLSFESVYLNEIATDL